jgi:predicted nucleic acid-binding protein
MIVLDTNVLSAFMREFPDPRVVRWLDGNPRESMWTTSITVFEIRYGLATMPTGKRRRVLEDAFERQVSVVLQNRVLDFDAAAASESAILAASRSRKGRPIDTCDAQIAGIAIARRASIATRDAKDFEDVGIVILDPWKE